MRQTHRYVKCCRASGSYALDRWTIVRQDRHGLMYHTILNIVDTFLVCGWTRKTNFLLNYIRNRWTVSSPTESSYRACLHIFSLFVFEFFLPTFHFTRFRSLSRSSSSHERCLRFLFPILKIFHFWLTVWRNRHKEKEWVTYRSRCGAGPKQKTSTLKIVATTVYNGGTTHWSWGRGP